GEVEINAYLAGVYNVPIAFISGDDVLESEVKDFFPAGIPYARTKEGIGRFAGKMYSPARVEETFRDSVRQMLNRWGNLKPTELPAGDITLSIDFPTTVIADAVSIIPGFNRTAGRTAEYTSVDYRNIYRMILSSTMLGGRFVQYL
ncbi:MAG: M55 family metallopeptidase, partial [Spirochaetaceae bacterium]|nr:M55 family metallopeptidase [Spirochaetaceae bacterium]